MKRTVCRFTDDEDKLIMEHVNDSQSIESALPTLLRILGKRHSERAIRDRYTCFLSQSRAEWTKKEDKILIQSFKEYENKWTLIAKFFPNRSAEQCKIRINQLCRTNKRLKQRVFKGKKKKKQPTEKPSEETKKPSDNTDDDGHDYIWDKISEDYERSNSDVFIFGNEPTEIF